MQKTVIDQLGRTITVNFPPKRIVSLVPSQTELLFDLGLDQEIVGITKFCIHPIEKFATRVKVGGTKKLNISLIKELNPDLIIANKEENTQIEIEALMNEFPVWISDVGNLSQALEMITGIGELVNRAPEAYYLNHLIKTGFSDLEILAKQVGYKKSVAYLIWKDPFMFAGQGTFINDILDKIGLENIISTERYPSSEIAVIQEKNPKFIFLSSEPYPFKAKHIADLEKLFPESKVLLVDGEMFSWYGSRLVKAISYLFQLQKELHQSI